MEKRTRIVVSLFLGLLAFVNVILLVAVATILARTPEGGLLRLGLRMIEQPDRPVSGLEIESTRVALYRRLELLGVEYPVVEWGEVAGGEEIALELPMSTDVEGAKRVLTSNDRLEITLQAKGTGIFEQRVEAEDNAGSQSDGEHRYKVLFYRSRPDMDGSGREGWVAVEETPVITDADMKDARAKPSPYSSPNYEIDFSLRPEAAARMANVTGQHVGDYFAVVLNDEVKSIAVITSQITDRGVIQGSFDKRAAEDLALVLRSGRLPRPLEIVSEQSVPSHSANRSYVVLGAVLSLMLIALAAALYRTVRSRATGARTPDAGTPREASV